MNQDTICALATANGVGAIGIIRVSGAESFAIVNRVFEGKDLEKVASHTVHYGFIKDGEEVIDEVMVSVFMRQERLRPRILWRYRSTVRRILGDVFWKS